ncbi:MAG: ring-opening amidohydrolase [Acuticoccus sp.]
MRQARVSRIAMRAPDDVGGIRAAIAAGTIDPHRIVAIFAKTEGNGCVNDFTRAFAAQSLRLMLGELVGAEAAAGVALVMSGGTEGALAPHWLVFEVAQDAAAAAAPARDGALAVGTHLTRAMAPEEIGRRAQVETVAEGTRAAMEAAAIADPADVHFVQVKCPLLTAERVADAARRGTPVRTDQTLKSMGFSRGAAALGVGFALGEIAADALRDEARIGTDTSLFSGRASTSAGVELMVNEITVLGRSADWGGPLTIEHAVMGDALDTPPVLAALGRAGLAATAPLPAADSARVVAVLAKAEPSSSGMLRGHRHTMLDDSDISPTRHARAFTGGVLAGIFGHGELFVSGGAEHQGPDGGGPVAVIVRR